MAQRVVSGAGVGGREVADAAWRRIAERVEALVVIAGDEAGDSALGQGVDELQDHRVEILELVDDQVIEIEQRHRVERPGLDALDTLLHKLARQHARVELGARAVDPRKREALAGGDRRVRRGLAGRPLVMAGAPQRLEVLADLPRSHLAADPGQMPELGIK